MLAVNSALTFQDMAEKLDFISCSAPMSLRISGRERYCAIDLIKVRSEPEGRSEKRRRPKLTW